MELYLARLPAPGSAALQPARPDFLKKLITLDLEYAWRPGRDGTIKGPVAEEYRARRECASFTWVDRRGCSLVYEAFREAVIGPAFTPGWLADPKSPAPFTGLADVPA
jgi:hypothetical protein